MGVAIAVGECVGAVKGGGAPEGEALAPAEALAEGLPLAVVEGVREGEGVPAPVGGGRWQAGGRGRGGDRGRGRGGAAWRRLGRARRGGAGQRRRGRLGAARVATRGRGAGLSARRSSIARATALPPRCARAAPRRAQKQGDRAGATGEGRRRAHEEEDGGSHRERDDATPLAQLYARRCAPRAAARGSEAAARHGAGAIDGGHARKSRCTRASTMIPVIDISRTVGRGAPWSAKNGAHLTIHANQLPCATVRARRRRAGVFARTNLKCSAPSLESC